ncbi:hypothetical protein PENSPDRAFT_306576 [Peniophora sp. CONT]|nr:hypothetical protein PENSPDRAFT_306576 [Peniophora sp. CONT]
MSERDNKKINRGALVGLMHRSSAARLPPTTADRCPPAAHQLPTRCPHPTTLSAPLSTSGQSSAQLSRSVRFLRHLSHVFASTRYRYSTIGPRCRSQNERTKFAFGA